MAFEPFDVAALVKEINSSSKSLNQGRNEDARQQCLAAARSLCCALETPLDSTLRLCYSDVFIDLQTQDQTMLTVVTMVARTSGSNTYRHRAGIVSKTRKRE